MYRRRRSKGIIILLSRYITNRQIEMTSILAAVHLAVLEESLTNVPIGTSSFLEYDGKSQSLQRNITIS